VPSKEPIAFPDLGTTPFRVVWGAGSKGRFEGKEFFESECSEDQASKFFAAFKMVAQYGPDFRMPSVFKYPMKHTDGLGEFRTFQKRLYFFRSGADFVITNGATKKKDETDQRDLDRANRIRREIGELEKADSRSPLTPTARGKRR